MVVIDIVCLFGWMINRFIVQCTYFPCHLHTHLVYIGLFMVCLSVYRSFIYVNGSPFSVYVPLIFTDNSEMEVAEVILTKVSRRCQLSSYGHGFFLGFRFLYPWGLAYGFFWRTRHHPMIQKCF